jgi:hypothetical protein
MKANVTKDGIRDMFNDFSKTSLPVGLKASLVIVGYEETELYRAGINILREDPSVVMLGYDCRDVELDDGVEIKEEIRENRW